MSIDMVIENSELMMLLRPIKWVCPTLLRVPGRALYYCGAHPVGLGVSIRYNYLYKRYI